MLHSFAPHDCVNMSPAFEYDAFISYRHTEPDTSSGRLLHKLRLEANVQDIQFSPDGKLIGISSFNKKLTVWNLASGKMVWQKQLIDYCLPSGSVMTGKALRALYGCIHMGSVQ